MHLLILGGSTAHPGGVEAFCERSAAALLRRDDRWTIHRISTETAYLTVKRIPAMLRQIGALIAYRNRRPDIVWIQYVNLPELVFVLIAKGLGFKVMVTPHLGSNWKSQRNVVLRWLSGKMFGLADRIALISSTQPLEIAMPNEPPRSLIRNFLPEAILTSELSAIEDAPDTLRLIHAARLSADKGSFMVVQIAAKLRDANVPFAMRIVGGADVKTYAMLKHLIGEHGLEQVVEVTGRVSDDALIAALTDSDALIHLSRIDSYPLILLEGMACSMIPIAMELAGARDMIETYDGQIVSQDQPVEEAAAWLIAADRDDLRRRGRAQAGRVRSDYNWSRCADALAAALEACVAGSREITEPREAV